MKKVVIPIIALVILIAGGLFLWQNRHEALFQGEEIETEEESDESASREGSFFDFFSGSGDDDDDNEEDIEEVEVDEELDELDEEEMANITAADCENGCGDWEEDEDDFEICKEICGIKTEEELESETIGDCEEMEDVEGDICFHRKAIDEKDASLCNKIGDDSLKKNCQDRVLEEILDQQGL